MASVRKRTWKTPDGVTKMAWVCEYTDENGKRRRITVDSKKEADSERQRVEAELVSGMHTPLSTAATIKEVAERYLEHVHNLRVAGTVGRGHYDNIELVVRTSIVPRLGRVKLAALTIEQVNDFTRYMIEEQRLAMSTVARRRDILGRIEGWARVVGMTKRNVVADAKKVFPLRQTERIRIPTKAEVALILDDVERSEGDAAQRRARSITRIFVYCAALCGMRWGEIAGLSLPHVDVERRVLRIRHSVTEYDEHKTPKTRAGVRDVPMPHALADALAHWIDSYYRPNERELLFSSRKQGHHQGRALQATNWHMAYWRPLLVRTGLAPADGGDWLHFHSLRHFAGSWWLEHGVAVTTVAKLLGHASPRITLEVYAHALSSTEDHRAVIDSISTAIAPPAPISPRQNATNFS